MKMIVLVLNGVESNRLRWHYSKNILFISQNKLIVKKTIKLLPEGMRKAWTHWNMIGSKIWKCWRMCRKYIPLLNL